MPDSRQILCIRRTDRSEAHERIARVSGVDASGGVWTMTQAEAVAAVQAGTWRFYASVWGRATWVVVGTTADGSAYLKTDTDGLQPNNLLTLPDMPPD